MLPRKLYAEEVTESQIVFVWRARTLERSVECRGRDMCKICMGSCRYLHCNVTKKYNASGYYLKSKITMMDDSCNSYAPEQYSFPVT